MVRSAGVPASLTDTGEAPVFFEPSALGQRMVASPMKQVRSGVTQQRGFHAVAVVSGANRSTVEANQGRCGPIVSHGDKSPSPPDVLTVQKCTKVRPFLANRPGVFLLWIIETNDLILFEASI